MELEGPLRAPLGSVQRKRASSRVEAGKNRALLDLWWETQHSSRVGMGIS